jgi:hypothetical protein
MDVKKIFKGFTKEEAQQIIYQSALTLEEIALASSIFIEHKPRLYFCDNYGCSTGKYHYMLNRVIIKLETALKLKLFGQ